jgi:putative tricarboxylic transport membrane protein
VAAEEKAAIRAAGAIPFEVRNTAPSDFMTHANVLMFATMTVSVRWLARAITIDRSVLLPIIFVCCVVGAYALSNRIYDVWVVVIFGIVGFGLERAKAPLGPFVIGFVLEPLFESELRSALQIAHGDFLGVLNRPIATSFLVIAAAMLAWPLLRAGRRKRPGVASTME